MSSLLKDYETAQKKKIAKIVLTSQILFGISMIATIAYLIWLSSHQQGR